jgi:hypothetical protein
MPPKRKAKVAAFEPEARPEKKQELEPACCSEPVPLGSTSEEGINALLPWLALGYGPVRTSGKDKQCGIRALWRSFIDARETLKSEGETLKLVTQAQFVKWMGSDKYRSKVEKYMQLPANNYLSAAIRRDIRKGMLQTDDLSSEQIRLLLEVANEEMGTNFVVGFVGLAVQV